MTNNVYKGVQAWMQALLEASQSNTLGNWWNARTLECVMLGTELSIAGKLEVYKDGLDFTKALFQAAKKGLLTQEDVDYNANKLLMINWKFQNHFFHLEENVDSHTEDQFFLLGSDRNKDGSFVHDVLTSNSGEAIITFVSDGQQYYVQDTIESSVEQQSVETVATPPKKALGGRPKKVNK